KSFALKLLLIGVVLLVAARLVVEGASSAWAALSASPLPEVLALLRNPGAGMAAAGAVAFAWWKRNEKELGGPEAAWHRVRSRITREGIRDLVRARPLAVGLTGATLFAMSWFWVFGSAFFFVPVVGAALYGRRRERLRLSGRFDPDAPLVPTRVIREPIWAFYRFREVPGDYEVWHLLGEGYRSRGLYEHVLLVGRTGHGKGQTVLLWAVAHSIACGRASTVVADAKAEAYEETVALAAARRGPEEPEGRPVWLLSTLEKHPREMVAGLNPCSGPEETARFASSIIAPTREPIWGQGARELFCAIARALDYPPDCVVRVYEHVKYLDRLKALAQKSAEVRAAYQADKPGMEENFRKTVKAALQALERERVARLFRASSEGGIDFGRRNVVYVCFAPDSDADARPLLAGLLDHLYASAYDAGEPGKGGPGAEFIVDEAKKCAAIHKFPDYLAIARGNRVRFLVCVQNVSQLVDELGEPAAQDLLDSLPLKIVGQSGDERTKRMCEDESGHVSIVREAAGGKAPLPVRLFDRERARMAEWSGQRWERRPRVRGDHVKELPKNEWFVLGAGVAERVVGAAWREYRERVVTPEMRRLEPNRVGIPPRAPAEKEPTTEELTEPAAVGDPGSDGEVSEEPNKQARGRPRLRLVGSENGGTTAVCPYCDWENPAGEVDCSQCGMPLG
ncbi:MAG: type IV secretory system conjugative DNA transfer family protein, partial [Actinomycetota bacterium]